MNQAALSFDDEVSKLACANPPKNLTKSPQYAGCVCDCHPAIRRILANSTVNRLDSSPASILASIRESDYIGFVVRVGVWGGMIPGPLGAPFKMIFQSEWRCTPESSRINAIESAMKQINLSLSKDSPGLLKEHWELLTGNLGWSSVIASKVLHFIYRSHGYNDSCPVPVDNAMCRKWLWPQFREKLRNGRMKSINGNSFEPYLRYLSAIKGWADAYKWGMPEMECALFGKWRDDRDARIF